MKVTAQALKMTSSACVLEADRAKVFPRRWRFAKSPTSDSTATSICAAPASVSSPTRKTVSPIRAIALAPIKQAAEVSTSLSTVSSHINQTHNEISSNASTTASPAAFSARSNGFIDVPALATIKQGTIQTTDTNGTISSEPTNQAANLHSCTSNSEASNHSHSIPIENGKLDGIDTKGQSISYEDHLADINDDEGRFRVATYNILSDHCIPEGQYLHCPEQVRYMAARHGHIMAEVQSMSPEIICLQEVEINHYESTLAPSLQNFGYMGVHVSTAVGQGLTIFWKNNVFKFVCKRVSTTRDIGAELMKKKSAELDSQQMSQLVAALDRPEASLGVRLRHLSSGRDVVVVNVHIAWTELRGPALQTFQIWMGMKLLQEISQKSYGIDSCNNSRYPDHPCKNCDDQSHCGNNTTPDDQRLDVNHVAAEYGPHEKSSGIQEMPSDSPTVCAQIICGDFNTPPTYPGYRLLTEGTVSVKDFLKLDCMSHEKTSADEVSRLRAYGMVELLPDAYTTNEFKLQSSYKSVMGNEPEITNCDDASEDLGIVKPLCLDYIWFSPQTLEPTGALETPHDEAIFRHRCLPSILFPSDHIPLLTEFRFK